MDVGVSGIDDADPALATGENIAADLKPLTVFQNQGAVFGFEIVENAVGDDAVNGVFELDGSGSFELPGIKSVTVHEDSLAVGNQQVGRFGGEECVSGNGDIHGAIDIDGGAGITDYISGDGNRIDRPDFFASESNIGASRGDGLSILTIVRAVLNGASGDGDFSDRF